MKKFSTALLVIILLLGLVVSGCGPAAENGENGGEENGGEQVAEQRIISLMPSNTEILFALGLEDSIVGVTDFCNYPPEMESAVAGGRIERVGDAFNVNEELIVSLEPTLVLFGFESEANQALAERFSALDIVTAVIYPTTVRETLDSILTVGELTGLDEQAQKLVEDMEAALADIGGATGDLDDAEKPRVLMLLDLDSLYVAGAGTLENEMVTLAGGVNVIEAAGYSAISEEVVVDSSPDIILCSFPFREQILAEKESWSEIPAVAADAVHDLDGDLINRPTPRLVDGLQLLLSILHPDL